MYWMPAVSATKTYGLRPMVGSLAMLLHFHIDQFHFPLFRHMADRTR